MSSQRSVWRGLPPPLLAGFVLLIAMVGTSLALSIQLAENVGESGRISDYRRRITDVFNLARDAEIGQRGFLLTGKPAYLEPYDRAVVELDPTLAALAKADAALAAPTAAQLEPLARAKMAELSKTIAMTRSGKAAEAIAIVNAGAGKKLMDDMRAIFEHERQSALKQASALEAASRLIVWWLTVVLVGGMIALIGLMLYWLRQAQRQLGHVESARNAAESALAALRSEVSAREKAEDMLRHMQKMEAVGQLTGGIAHDFNNMLAVVMGGLELAQRRLRSDPDKTEQYLANAKEGAQRAATLTARLLAFSRQQALEPQPLDANKLVRGMSDLLDRTLGEAVAVETVLSGGLWRCYADPGELENALLNLAVNARDAMDDAGKLTIETANGHIDDAYTRVHGNVDPGQYVTICVSDTGSGMSEDVIARAFDPFFTTKGVGKGTGLGLSQVFGFAKQSGGHVTIYSEVGTGTTVKLYLPRFIGTGDSVPAARDTVATPEGKASEVILVVEDEHRVRHFAVDVLRELGYTALSASSPAEALEILAEQPDVTLLFTDIVMPEMNGRQLADQARVARPGLKVLFTTGYTRNAVVHNGMVDIGVAFLPKPYTIGDLARKVRQVCDGGGVKRIV